MKTSTFAVDSQKTTLNLFCTGYSAVALEARVDGRTFHIGPTSHSSALWERGMTCRSGPCDPPRH